MGLAITPSRDGALAYSAHFGIGLESSRRGKAGRLNDAFSRVQHTCRGAALYLSGRGCKLVT